MADTKFAIADITSTLTSTPPAKTSVSTITSTPINTGSISNIEVVPKSDIEVVPNVDEFTTKVRREVGIDDNYVVLGDGIFDKLMKTATEHLAIQFVNGRIRGEDYSTAYIQVFQATLQTALTIWLQKGLNEKQLALELASKNAELRLQADMKNAELKLQADLSKNQGDLQWAVALLQRDSQEALVEAQVDHTTAQIASEESKRDLYRRQIEGFDEDYKQKILKIMMDSWAVGFSVARDSFEASGIPAPMQKVTIDDLYNQYVITELDKYNYGRPIVNKP